MNDDGTLTYSFIESVKFTYPYYGLRLLGGLVFFAGMLVMVYNVWRHDCQACEASAATCRAAGMRITT